MTSQTFSFFVKPHVTVHSKLLCNLSFLRRGVEFSSVILLFAPYISTPFFIANKKPMCQGAWVAQMVKCPTLDFGSGHDLTLHEIEPWVWLCTNSTEPAWVFLSLSFCPYPTCSLSLKINK